MDIIVPVTISKYHMDNKKIPQVIFSTYSQEKNIQFLNLVGTLLSLR